MIHAEASDNSPVFSYSSTPKIGIRPRTINAINWDIFSWPLNTWQTGPDISGVIQEVVDRPGWVIDNSLSILICNRSDESEKYVTFEEYDSYYPPEGNLEAAIFEVTYKLPRVISGYVVDDEGLEMEGVLLSASNGGGEGVTDINRNKPCRWQLSVQNVQAHR